MTSQRHRDVTAAGHGVAHARALLHVPHPRGLPAKADALRVEGGLCLTPDGWTDHPLRIEHGELAGPGGSRELSPRLDARGLLVLPGIVDIHGDAFERLIAPRPAAPFDPAFAFLDADRQLAANGVTTAFHAPTWSWEGGTRGAEATLAAIEAVEALRPHFAVDARIHLRHEVFNLDAEATILEWIAAGRIDCLAFNDHMTGTIKERHRPEKMRGMIERSRLDEDAFHSMVDGVHARAEEVPGSVERLAAAGREAGLPMLSHDDMTPEGRAGFRSLGVRVAEFPVNEATAMAAAAAGDPIVFGAPNVVRGGSHTGCPSAAEMAGRGWCTALASDYVWPSLAFAPFLLEARGVLDLAASWRLVSAGPADALGLTDRGAIAEGLRADLVLVAPRAGLPPRIVATIANGRIAHLAEADRYSG